MIVSNRAYPLGSKIARIHTRSFRVNVSTAKEGFFQKQSTMISEGDTTGVGVAGLRPCGKVIYSSSLRKSDRLKLHDVLVETLHVLGQQGYSLRDALDRVFQDWRQRGIAIETINTAVLQEIPEFEDELQESQEPQERPTSLSPEAEARARAFFERFATELEQAGDGESAVYKDGITTFWMRPDHPAIGSPCGYCHENFRPGDMVALVADNTGYLVLHQDCSERMNEVHIIGEPSSAPSRPRSQTWKLLLRSFATTESGALPARRKTTATTFCDEMQQSDFVSAFKESARPDAPAPKGWWLVPVLGIVIGVFLSELVQPAIIGNVIAAVGIAMLIGGWLRIRRTKQRGM